MTKTIHSRRTTIALAAGLCACMVLAADAAKIKIKAEPDPAFDFATVKTWAWDADAGQVMMARTPTDDPAAVKQRIDPLIRRFVEGAMTKKGLAVASGAPDVQLHYYVLVTVSQSGQYMGQFLPSVAYWGLPPFAPQATSLDVATKGSLVIDAMLPAAAADRRKVIWRGMAESTLDESSADAKRDARIREACEGLIEKFPLKKKK
jgi:Domain of unknown function (DUF4136)